MNYDYTSQEKYPLQEETGAVIGDGVTIHKILGPGFLEIVYKDAFEYEFKTQNVFLKEKRSIRSDIKAFY
ncbi:hypothetical protein KTO63_12425 [Parasegetibacter sp. MAH-26]|uniref:GxxExxY protein n=1 Tax=Pinibacter aurantiacus TaxID=2851599 RepID=A0A9E2W305_9BACT|nr:hypothetical protein [Pinibacter aurantiacus]